MADQSDAKPAATGQDAARAELLRAFQIAPGPAATEPELARAEAALGSALPEGVRGWYATANGGVARAPGAGFELLSLEKAMVWLRNWGMTEGAWGYFPFALNDDSNPVCVCCRGLLKNYVVQIPHDDAPRLLYRGVSGFFREACTLLARGGSFDTDDLVGDFAGPERTDDDVRLARALIASAGTGSALGQEDRSAALRFACDLLPASHVQELRELADLGDESVSAHVLMRLRGVDSVEARSAVALATQEFDDFVEDCASLLRREGIAASVSVLYSRKALRLDANHVGLNVEMFFAERKRADFEQFFLTLARRSLSRSSKA